MAVHFVEVAREKGRFVAARPRVDLHNAAGPVRVFAPDRHIEQLVPVDFAFGAQFRQFRFREFAQFGIVPFEHLFGLFDLLVELLKPPVFSAQFRKRAVFARDRRQTAGVGKDVRIVHLTFEFFKSGEFLVE